MVRIAIAILLLAVTADGRTALMLAADLARADLVERLIAAGASPALAARDGWTAEQAARMVGEDALADRLAALSRRR